VEFLVVGAGAIGGVVAARLWQAGHDVVAVARGAHRAAIEARGLELRTPLGTETVPVPVADLRSLRPDRDRVALLAVKSHQTGAAVRELADTVGRSTPIVCLQNGVANEATAAATFDDVYGVAVMCPTLHLEPGVVEASSSSTTGLLDIGRFPEGRDATAEAVAAAFNGATFASIVRDDIMRWKWAKLLLNLGNIIEAACGPAGRRGAIAQRARAEGEACLRAAGIDFVSAGDDAARRGDILRVGEVDGRARPGGSTWQSVARGARELETEFLNGEIVRLGARHGVPTPANAMLCALATEIVARQMPPASYTVEELLARLPDEPA
jgi:2-dehydropantoate 2-reductase